MPEYTTEIIPYSYVYIIKKIGSEDRKKPKVAIVKASTPMIVGSRRSLEWPSRGCYSTHNILFIPTSGSLTCIDILVSAQIEWIKILYIFYMHRNSWCLIKWKISIKIVHMKTHLSFVLHFFIFVYLSKYQLTWAKAVIIDYCFMWCFSIFLQQKRTNFFFK